MKTRVLTVAMVIVLGAALFVAGCTTTQSMMGMSNKDIVDTSG